MAMCGGRLMPRSHRRGGLPLQPRLAALAMAVTLTWLLPDGRAAGPDPEGGVLKVGGAVPGDVVAPGPDGDVHLVVQRSPDRIEPACPWSSACGGCGLDGITAEARRRGLARMVAHAFGQSNDPPVVPSPEPVAHRARIKLALEAGRAGYRAARSPRSGGGAALPHLPGLELQTAHGTLVEWLAAGPSEGLASGGAAQQTALEPWLRVRHRWVGAARGPGSTFRASVTSPWTGVGWRATRCFTLPRPRRAVARPPRSFYQVNLDAQPSSSWPTCATPWTCRGA